MKSILKKIIAKIIVIILVILAFIVGYAVSTYWSLHNMPELEYDNEGNVVGIPN